MMRRRSLRPLGLVLTLVSLSVGGAAAADVLTEDPPPREGADTTPRPNTATLDAAAVDPAGGPRWRMRVYESQDGRRCSQVGQESGDRIGHVRGDGGFRELQLHEGGSCVQLASQAASVIITTLSDVPVTAEVEPERTIVRGLARPDVAAIRIVGSSDERTLEPSGRGAFLAVYEGTLTFRELDVYASDANGAETKIGD